MGRRRISAILILALAVTAGIGQAKSNEMSVQVRKGEIRETPSFLGNIIASVEYGDRLTVLREQGPWTLVSTDNTKGWIHTSALTKKKIKLVAGEKVDSAASSGELALAGKGFNSEVEAEFKAKNKDVDFTWVDKMEKSTVPIKDIQKFIKEGELQADKGGAQ